MKYMHWFEFDNRARPATMRNRRHEINRYVFRWFNMEVEDLLPEHVQEFKAEWEKKGLSVNYIRKMLFVLRALMRYLRQKHKLKVLESYEIEVPKQPRRKVSYFNLSEVKSIFTFKPETIFDYRLMAWVMLILSTGMRATESLGVMRTKIDFQTMIWRGEPTQAYVTSIEGKGGIYRTVIIQPWAMEWLQAYWNLRTDDHPAAFVNHHHHATERGEHTFWRYEDLRSSLKRLDQILGRIVRSHELRRTASTLARFNGADTKTLQDMLGHLSLQYTELYLGVNYNQYAHEITRFVHYEGLPNAPKNNQGGVWAIGLNIASCKGCSTTERKHSAQGYCHRCYMNIRNEKKRKGLTKLQPGRIVGVS